MYSRIFNSTLYLLCAYMLIHVFYLSIKYIFVKLLGVNDALLYFTDVYFDPFAYSSWTRIKIFFVYGLPTFITFLFGLIAIPLYNKTNKDNSRFQLFYIWVFVVGTAFFIADLVKAPFYRGTLSSVYEWFYLPTEFGFLVAVITLPLLPVVAYIISKPAVQTANSREFIKKRTSRLFYFSNIMLAPLFIVGFVITLMMWNTENYPLGAFFEREGIRFIVLFFIIIIGAFFSYSMTYLTLRRHGNLAYIKKEITAMLLITIAVVYIVLYYAI